MDTDDLVNMYVRAWHERDEARRREMLEATWSVDGIYTDPGGTIEGRETLIAAIADFQESRPDVRIEVRSAIDAFGRHFRFVWATVDGAGETLREGIDVGQLGEDGRIASIIGFVGIAP